MRTPIAFDAPLWLLAAALIPFIVWQWYSFAARPWNPRSFRWLPWLRATALLALIMVVAQATWIRRSPDINIHIVYDQSLSMEAARPSSRAAVIDTIHDSVDDTNRIHHYGFAGDIHYAGSGSQGLADLHRGSAQLNQNQTNIEKALRHVIAHADPDENHRIVLITDGWETDGRADDVAPIARSRHIPIDTYQKSPPSPEVLVDRFIAPPTVTRMEPYRLQAVIASTDPTEGTLTLYRNGTLIASHTMPLDPGSNVITFGGLIESDDSADASVTYTIRVEAEDDTLVENNAAHTVVRVDGAADVLVVGNDQQIARLADTLQSAGLSAATATPDTAPWDPLALRQYRAVVAVDLDADFLSPGERASLADYVQKGGGGLLAVGGPNSFGMGGYHGTALEDVLPVTAAAPQHVVIPSLAIVLLLDRSGSMAETQGEYSKLDLAKEAALSVLDLLHPRDLFGVIAFDSGAEWIVPLQPAQNRLDIALRIAGLTAEGGTNLGAALRAATEPLIEAHTALKHLIALTDGRSMVADFEALTRALERAGITVSTVGIGRDADRDLLDHIARWGEGRFYYTEDIRAIPQIFAAETTVVMRPIVDETPFQPHWQQLPEFWTNPRQLPQLGGYIMATPKSTATVYVRTEEDHPVLAAWRAGLGRSAALLSDITGPWAGEWAQWNEYPDFVAQLVRWLMRPAPSSQLFSHVTHRGGQGEITVDALDEDGRFLNFLQLTADVVGPSGIDETLILHQGDPGRYGGAFTVPTDGAYTIYIRDQHDLSRWTEASLIVPYSEEFRVIQPDTGLLIRLAQETGGTALEGTDVGSIKGIVDHPQPVENRIPLAPFLLATALSLFLADVAVRYALKRDAGTVVEDPVEKAPTTLSPGEELMKRIEADRQEEERHRPEVAKPSAASEAAKAAQAGKFLAERRKRRD